MLPSMDGCLTQGKVAHIDDKDWPLVSAYKWYAARDRGNWYAHATPLDGDRLKAKIKMHNLILAHLWVDHISENGLDNRRGNLRACDNPMNQQNTGSRGGSSEYKGVSWNKVKGKWVVAFRCNRQSYFVGYFADEVEAAKAYDAAIAPLAGEFARLNFPLAA